MDLKQARTRIARAKAAGAGNAARDIEKLCGTLIEKLPRNGSAQTELVFKILEHLAANQSSGVRKRLRQPWFEAQYRLAAQG